MLGRLQGLLQIKNIHFNIYNLTICFLLHKSIPLLIFDLLWSVSDALWSPFSSTVFGVITEDCDVVFYDLDADKYKNICSQPIQPESQYQLTKLAFNWRMPVIVVGSSK